MTARFRCTTTAVRWRCFRTHTFSPPLFELCVERSERFADACAAADGGIAGPNGGTYASTLGYPDIGEWTHVVATFENGCSACAIFRNDAGHQLVDYRPVTSSDGDDQLSVGGLENFVGHEVRVLRPTDGPSDPVELFGVVSWKHC